MKTTNGLCKDFADGVKEKGLNVRGIVVRQHNEILDEHDFIEPARRQLFSASKTFTSMAVGIAIGEGRLKLTDRFVDLLKDELPETLPENFDRLTVRHLLTMSTGHRECPVTFMRSERMKAAQASGEARPPRRPMPEAGPEEQGKIRPDTATWFMDFCTVPLTYDPDDAHFAYNNAATYMLSCIITKVTGEALVDYLKPRIFTPLGIEDPKWDMDPQGRNLGAIGLYLTTEELARGGQLLLNKGKWNGVQLIPEDYAVAMTEKQVDNSHNFEPGQPVNDEAIQGYCYQMWRCTYPGAYRMDGMAGQFSICIPDLDAVVGITSFEMKNTYEIMKLVWSTIVPKLK